MTAFAEWSIRFRLARRFSTDVEAHRGPLCHYCRFLVFRLAKFGHAVAAKINRKMPITKPTLPAVRRNRYQNECAHVRVFFRGFSTGNHWRFMWYRALIMKRNNACFRAACVRVSAQCQENENWLTGSGYDYSRKLRLCAITLKYIACDTFKRRGTGEYDSDSGLFFKNGFDTRSSGAANQRQIECDILTANNCYTRKSTEDLLPV